MAEIPVVGGKRREASEFPRRYKGGANLPTTKTEHQQKSDPTKPKRELPCTCELNGSYCVPCGPRYHYNQPWLYEGNLSE